MDKYITSVKDLVIEAISHFSIIKTSADKGDVSSCFKMGMIHLLGIDTAVDFKKAVKYFGNQSLANNRDAICLLGLIAELEGNFSQAFHYYESTESSEKDSYLDKVIKGRNKLQDYLKKLDLPITVNKDISTILGDYSKGKASKVGASIKIAAICDDDHSCYEAAKALYDSDDYISAIQWLQKGNIGLENTLYTAINEKFEKSKDILLHSKEKQVIELDSNSLLSTEDPTPFLNKVKESCEEASVKSNNEWKNKNKKRIDTIIKIKKEKEYKEMLEAQAEEEARKKKRNKIIKYCAIAASVLFFYIIGSIGSGGNGDNNESEISKKQDYSLLHDLGNTTKISHHFIGNFSDSYGVFPVEIVFSSKGKEISDVIYKNVKIGGKIKMKCTNFENNDMRFEGKDGKKEFILSLSWTDRNELEGVATVGTKKLDVKLNSDCIHTN